MTRILGIGNALVDIMTELDHDGYLPAFGLPKGSMTLVDAEKSKSVFDGTRHLKKTVRSGGSAANTIYGIARMGIQTGFIGKIGRDEMGQVFRQDMIDSNVRTHLIQSDTESGTAMALISPDSERTFATYLGAAVELSGQDLDESIFREYDVVHIEGYLVQNHDLLLKAMELAKRHHLKISIDMASYNVVEANREFLYSVIKDYVDIVFANEDEAKALTGKEPAGALEDISAHCDIAVVKTGRTGSLVKSNETMHPIGIIPVNSIDTTGAGDLYASGFLYGLANRLPLEQCGRIGAILAGRTIEVVGAKMDEERWQKARQMINKL
jgi:sugar/nucleoside kinase (ribokinase family)